MKSYFNQKIFYLQGTYKPTIGQVLHQACFDWLIGDIKWRLQVIQWQSSFIY